MLPLYILGPVTLTSGFEKKQRDLVSDASLLLNDAILNDTRPYNFTRHSRCVVYSIIFDFARRKFCSQIVSFGFPVIIVLLFVPLGTTRDVRFDLWREREEIILKNGRKCAMFALNLESLVYTCNAWLRGMRLENIEHVTR